MQRRIVGFHQDETSDWVAELECGHARHTRHDPPWSERPWVLTEEGRASRLGEPLPCARCDRRELPDGYAPHRRTATFSEATLPERLRHRHTTKRGVWAHIRVERGRLRYRLHEPFHEEQILEPGTPGIVPPEVEHEVEPLGPVEFFVEFYRPSDGMP
jgi:tellurite resistance-related uncharacterized protein